MNFIAANEAGFAAFAIIPHAYGEDRPDASAAGAEGWAAKLAPVPGDGWRRRLHAGFSGSLV